MKFNNKDVEGAEFRKLVKRAKEITIYAACVEQYVKITKAEALKAIGDNKVNVSINEWGCMFIDNHMSF